MNKQIISLVASALTLCATAQAQQPAIPRDAKMEAKIEKTLSKMTLEEKIGQMTELTIDVIGKYENGKFAVDEDKMATIFGKYKVGSILNAPGTCAPTVEQWQEYITAIQKASMKYIGIPCVYGLDQNHGVTYTQGGTLFPQNINVAATFNTQVAYDAARITAYETRASNCPWTYSPTLDLSRDARWPRMWEDFGEDCLLNAEMGAAMIRGFQGDDPNHIDKYHIGTSVKHYMGYGVPRTGKDRTPAYISPQELREKHFAPYLAAARAGALTMMVNSSSINGTPTHANYELLTKWLKEDLGWDGMLVTDWADINNLYQREKVAKDKKDAIRIAINAGIDMSMDPYSTDFCELLKELVDEGKVSMDRINDATRRVLRLKYRLGLFDNPNTPLKDYPKFGSDEFASVALEGATESMVLLKNEASTLPIAKGKKILLTGPNANTMRCITGGWSYTWQGHLADQFATKYNTIREAMELKYGADNIVYEPGVTYNEKGKYYEENAPEYDRAVAAAEGVDVIVACIGENSYTETPGNLDDLWLSAQQRELVKRLAATGKPIVLVLNEGRPRLVSDIEPLASAVVDILIPGNYGGDALANLLAGDSNFSGRMPVTYPRFNGALTNYDYKASEESETMEGAYDYNAVVSVQWPFGFGKSYTTYEYSNLTCSKPQFTADDELVFSVDVKNTGSMAGKESVLLFSSDKIASIVPDGRRLRAFTKIELQPGETKRVELKLKGSDLAFVGADAKWVLEEGDFRVQVGNQVADIQCTQTKHWDTPNK